MKIRGLFKKWDSLVVSLDKFSDDFMTGKIQPELQERKLYNRLLKIAIDEFSEIVESGEIF